MCICLPVCVSTDAGCLNTGKAVFAVTFLCLMDEPMVGCAKPVQATLLCSAGCGAAGPGSTGAAELV